MSYIEEALTAHYGERCGEFHDDCHLCRAWAEYDDIEWMIGRISELEAKASNLNLQREDLISHAARMAETIYTLKQNQNVGETDEPDAWRLP